MRLPGFIRLSPILFLLLGLTAALADTPTTQTQTANPGVSASELIQKAKQAFDNRDYTKAIDAYQKLAMQAPHDSRVLYNLGTAQAWAGHRGLAIWRLLQAQQLDPRNPDIRTNLRLVAPEMTHSPLGWLYGHFTANEWAAMAGGGSMLFFLLGALYYTRKSGGSARGRLRPLLWALAVLMVAAWPFALMHYYQREFSWRAVVVADNTVAYTGPSENQIENFKLRPGTIIRIEDVQTPGWVKFSYAGGRKGFVQRDRIRDL